MEPFFKIVRDAGIVQKRIAEAMGVSVFTFTRTKRGTQPITDDFRIRATDALSKIGIRKHDGLAYTIEELFYLPSFVTEVTNIPPSVKDGERVA